MAARVGGRNRFISWFVGLACAGVVAGLVYLALPMGPVLYAFLGDVLRSATGIAH